MTIGERIKTLRRKNDLTQEKLAEYLSVSSQAVSKWECGLACPDLSLIMPLTRILHVTADELLGGNHAENDARRAELDEWCKSFWKYDQDEMYRTACQAVSEYPGDYRYLTWLAEMEYFMAYEDTCKEDPAKPYSLEMMNRSIRHSNMVIEESTDPRLREKAIWNAMICCQYSGRYEEALQYAEMFPERKPITRDKAMEVCLRGDELTAHQQMIACRALEDFCMSMLELYRLRVRKASSVMAALDTEETVLKAVFPDGNYMTFHWHMFCIYETRTQLEIQEGKYDKAMEYLHILLEHGKQYSDLIESENQRFSCGIFDRITVNPANFGHSVQGMQLSSDGKPFIEKVREELMAEEIYAPLREREDFRRCMEALPPSAAAV